MAGWRPTAWCIALDALVPAARGGREFDLPDPARVPAPSFVATPADLADSFHLAAMPIRDAAGRGHEERARREASADWLRSNSQLRDLGAPGVAAWGEVLPHAAALGAAPTAAKALSPREAAGRH